MSNYKCESVIELHQNKKVRGNQVCKDYFMFCHNGLTVKGIVIIELISTYHCHFSSHWYQRQDIDINLTLGYRLLSFLSSLLQHQELVNVHSSPSKLTNWFLSWWNYIAHLNHRISHARLKSCRKLGKSFQCLDWCFSFTIDGFLVDLLITDEPWKDFPS